MTQSLLKGHIFLWSSPSQKVCFLSGISITKIYLIDLGENNENIYGKPSKCGKKMVSS